MTGNGHAVLKRRIGEVVVLLAGSASIVAGLGMEQAPPKPRDTIQKYFGFSYWSVCNVNKHI